MKQDIHQLICNNERFLYMQARKIAPSREEALDLAQDTILKILEQETKFDRNQNFKTWSAQVMRNLYINQYNRRKRYRVFATETNDMVHLVKKINNEGEGNLGMEFLENAIATLKKPQKKTFQLFFEGYNQKEIAQQFQMPVGTVKYHIFEAKRMLRSIINGEMQYANFNEFKKYI